MVKCKRGHENDITKMTLKMGGLLCSECRTIIFEPYVDKEYFEEFHRRRAEKDKEEKDKSEIE
jgi:hypothetical protein